MWTFTVIFGNITKLVGSIFTYWQVYILCAFMHLKKSKAFSCFFCFWDLKSVVETFYTSVIYRIQLEKCCDRQGIANSVVEQLPPAKAYKFGFTIIRGCFSLVPSHQLKPLKTHTVLIALCFCIYNVPTVLELCDCFRLT